MQDLTTLEARTSAVDRLVALITIVLTMVIMAVPELAHATASTDRVTSAVTNIATLLTAVGIGIVTIAIMVAGYKMAFSSARLTDVSNILIGGALAGGASGLAAWAFSG